MFSGSLRAFDETVRAGSIRKASEILGVAPSSVSRHIAILERQLGTALFYRRASGIELTHAGRLVSDYARSVLFEYDTLRTDLDDLRGTQRRLVKVALVESVAHFGPMSAIAQFIKSYKTVSFDVDLMLAPRVIEVVREGLYDIGISFCVRPDPDLLCLASVREPIVFVTSAKDPLACAAQVELKQLVSRPLALPNSEFGVRQILDRACADAGFRLKPAVTSNVWETLRDFVRFGGGCAILPWRAIYGRPGTEHLRAIPLAGSVFCDATIDVIVLRNRRLPRVVKSFSDQLIREISATP